MSASTEPIKWTAVHSRSIWLNLSYVQSIKCIIFGSLSHTCNITVANHFNAGGTQLNRGNFICFFHCANWRWCDELLPINSYFHNYIWGTNGPPLSYLSGREKAPGSCVMKAALMQALAPRGDNQGNKATVPEEQDLEHVKQLYIRWRAEGLWGTGKRSANRYQRSEEQWRRGGGYRSEGTVKYLRPLAFVLPHSVVLWVWMNGWMVDK